ncbi:MAG: ABC transporter permease [Candidatus Auribacterota bacterium]
MLRKSIIVVSLVIVAGLIISTVFAPLIAPYDPNVPDLDSIKEAPSLVHLMGTDDRGRDIFSRVLFAARFSLVIGLASTAMALVVGVVFGFLSGYYGGLMDSVIGLFTNITLAFPSLLLAIGLSAVMEPGFWSVFIAIVAISWAGFARLVRAETLKLKTSAHVDAARSLGAAHMYILIRHILPLCTGLIITTATLRIGTAMLTESSLSFLGLGIQPPEPTLGGMVSQGRDYFRSAPWITLFPGAVITLIIIALNTIGENYRILFRTRFEKN